MTLGDRIRLGTHLSISLAWWHPPIIPMDDVHDDEKRSSSNAEASRDRA